MRDETPEVIQALMRLDIKRLEADSFTLRVFRSDDGYAYIYGENGLVQGAKERLGAWRR